MRKSRVKNAKKEIEFFDEYDYFIVNDNLASASNELVSIANIARAKAKLFDKEKIVSNWLN
ncbi:hypothetical protein N5U23_11235 [Aliarcobacter butzleri]|uniref:hypothetical protein n=1 Tax=Aliarcobacter butzleri TaxID=28197 RepID=UPI0021B41297|nr:hypothetical protein [Aliarcobacter butzleri]MCT7564570.1 hypothetical protein [Aliarcobacter butzleri]